MFEPFQNLISFELEISASSGEETIYFRGDGVECCRQEMEKGLVKDVLTTMQSLQVLHVKMDISGLPDFAYAAALGNIIGSRQQWPNLKELVLGAVECDRHELMKVLEQHKSTLRKLCLQDMHLRNTSWAKLLPEIRRKLYLYDACICGEMNGTSEDPCPVLEHWNVSIADTDHNRQRDSINAYCRFGGEGYPDVCPLNDVVVAKHYDLYVKGQIHPDWDSDVDFDSDETDQSNLEDEEDEEDEEGQG
jgi:hypothetical protein